MNQLDHPRQRTTVVAGSGYSKTPTVALADCDLWTISPGLPADLPADLQASQSPQARVLDADAALPS